MHGPVLFPGCTPGAAALPARQREVTEIPDKEPNASPRALDVSGEFYAVAA